MLEMIKSVHLLSLYCGGAASIGSFVLMYNIIAEGGPPHRSSVRALQLLGRIGLASIMLIWITGLFLIHLLYQSGLALGYGFVIKLVLATIVLGAVLALTVVTRRGEAHGHLPDASWSKPLSVIILAGTLTTMVLSVILFAGR